MAEDEVSDIDKINKKVTESNLLILVIALEASIQTHLEKFWPKDRMTFINDIDEFSDLLENPGDYKFCAAFCGANSEQLQPDEIAQFFGVSFPETPVFYIASRGNRHKKNMLLENGFHDVFFEPFDESLLIDMFSEISQIDEFANKNKFSPIKLIDIEPETVLDFDIWIYMPLNKKHVLFLKAGQSFSAERLERLRSKHISSAYLLSSELTNFYEYTARKLYNLTKENDRISETEKRQKLEAATRELFSSIFDEAETSNISKGKVLREQCTQIVSEFIKQVNKDSIYSKILNSVSDTNNHYAHSVSVSTFAALFAIGTGLSDPEDLALAGLLHDIGLSEIPPEILNKPLEDFTLKEYRQYIKHPELSVKSLQNKKIIINENVQKGILEHHESYDGKGFPNRLKLDNISIIGQVLRLADEFDYLTTVQEGRKRVKPIDALEKIKKSGAVDARVVDRVLKLFPEHILVDAIDDASEGESA